MSRGEPLAFAQVHPARPLDAQALEAFLVRLSSDPTSTPVVFEARSHREAAAGAGPHTTYWVGTEPQHARWLRRT